MGRNVYDAAEDLPIWQAYLVLLLFPVFCFFSFRIILPQFLALYILEPEVTYSFRKVYALLAPIIFIPAEIMGFWKFVLKRDLPKAVFNTLEKTMLYGGIAILLVAPLSNFIVQYYIENNGYVYCRKKSDMIWRQVYVLDEALCSDE